MSHSLAEKPIARKLRPFQTQIKGDNSTQQQFKNECDINQILKKYQKTGAFNHANTHSPNYDFASALDFRESMEIVQNAQSMFQELPSSIRAKFHNNPEEFLDFTQNPENASEMVSLGLIPKEETKAPVRVEVITTDPKTPLQTETETK